MTSIAKIQENIFVHVPFCSFPEYRSRIADHRLNVEILITADDLDREPHASIREIGRFLSAHQLSCTIHGPFLDLDPGSSDSRIRMVSRERYQQLLALIPPLAPRIVVFHADFDPLFYGDRAEIWLKRSIETWLSVAEAAKKAGTRIALENVLEKTPQIIQELIQKVDSPSLGMCLDIGHAHIFSPVPLPDWVSSLGSRIFELHLHDNHGQEDEHLALGEGTIDVQGVLKAIQHEGIFPALTIEALNEEHVMLSLQRLSSCLSR
ncbi:MAG: sugar phosphate isomerase/epimerase family protein [bacterium]